MSEPRREGPRKEVPFVMPDKWARVKKVAKRLFICAGILALIAMLLLGFIVFVTINEPVITEHYVSA